MHDCTTEEEENSLTSVFVQFDCYAARLFNCFSWFRVLCCAGDCYSVSDDCVTNVRRKIIFSLGRFTFVWNEKFIGCFYACQYGVALCALIVVQARKEVCRCDKFIRVYLISQTAHYTSSSVLRYFCDMSHNVFRPWFCISSRESICFMPIVHFQSTARRVYFERGTARNAESPECIMQLGTECLTPECLTTRPGMPNDQNA